MIDEKGPLEIKSLQEVVNTIKDKGVATPHWYLKIKSNKIYVFDGLTKKDQKATKLTKVFKTLKNQIKDKEQVKDLTPSDLLLIKKYSQEKLKRATKYIDWSNNKIEKLVLKVGVWNANKKAEKLATVIDRNILDKCRLQLDELPANQTQDISQLKIGQKKVVIQSQLELIKHLHSIEGSKNAPDDLSDIIDHQEDILRAMLTQCKEAPFDLHEKIDPQKDPSTALLFLKCWPSNKDIKPLTEFAENILRKGMSLAKQVDRQGAEPLTKEEKKFVSDMQKVFTELYYNLPNLPEDKQELMKTVFQNYLLDLANSRNVKDFASDNWFKTIGAMFGISLPEDMKIDKKIEGDFRRIMAGTEALEFLADDHKKLNLVVLRNQAIQQFIITNREYLKK